MEDSDPVEYPIDGELDLHQFRPQDVKDFVTDYLELFQGKEILKVRVVHGRGIGALKATVHALLPKLDTVSNLHLADDRSGGWGATWVYLHPKDG